VLPRRLELAIFAAQVVAALTLIRSVAYDRWITVLASVLLLLGAAAARRGKAWGVALAFASACAFPVAWAIGIAPAWFAVVGVVGALPFAYMSRAFMRFDARATAFLAAMAASMGAAGAILWKAFARSAFAAFPSLTPSEEANHGILLTVLCTLFAGALASRLLRRPAAVDATADARVRVADGLDRAEPAAAPLVEEDEAWNELEANEPPRRLRAKE
jgi:hypothetical protein